MTEELPLKEESAPTTEPLTTSGLPETDKKRVMIGSAIGGAVFLGVLITIIVLVSVEGSKSHNDPIRPVQHDVYPFYNPYIVFGVTPPGIKPIKVSIANNRKEFEQNITQYEGRRNLFPIVKDTFENTELNMIEVLINDYDEHLTRIRYTGLDERDRWHVPYYGNHSDPYAQAARYTHTPSGFQLQSLNGTIFHWNYMGKVGEYLPLMSTTNCRLQYFDKYIEFEALLDRDYIYGMGERIESFHLKNDNYSLWNRYLTYDVGGDTENGMYGSHPFILNRLTDTERDDFIGIFMRNSNAMLFSMWDHLHNGTTINYKMVGGIIDLFLFHTADPQYILRKYHSVIGRPYLPPLWGMGLQQAREGYTVKDFKDVIAAHSKHRIPVDALWADLEMNDRTRPFTVSSVSFAGIKELVTEMHDDKAGVDMHFVAIATPAIPAEAGNKYYDKALAENILIQSALDYGQPFKGHTMAGDSFTAVWLDFVQYNSTILWAEGLQDLHQLTLFDGIWIQDNEVYQRCSGECNMMSTDAEGSNDDNYGIPNPCHNVSEFSYLQYRPTLDPLEVHTLPMTAFHDGDAWLSKQYFMHNLFSIQSCLATYDALFGMFEDKRFLIASRSTWPGSGQFASHWLDGNFATWDSMISSIAGVLNFNMFGIPHVGAPIGGFYGNCDKELLARWFELGAFYPLMLSYSGSGGNRKEAYADEEVLPYIRNAIYERYTLIRFMYTKMFEAFAWGGAVVHPLFFDFTNETELYKRENLDRTFMWAHSLYIIPSLVPHQTIVTAFVPNWRWYDLRSLQAVGYYQPYMPGRYMEFQQPLGYITVLIKGGSIIPRQRLVEEAKIMNVRDLELIPAQLIVAPDPDGKAIGSMIVDTEGIRPHPDPKSNTYRHYTFTYMNRIFRINKLTGFDFHYDYKFDTFWELAILSTEGESQIDFVCYMDMSLRKKELPFLKMIGTDSLIIHAEEGAHEIPMPTLESIVWGSAHHHDFCRFQVHISEMKLSNQDRELRGTLSTSGAESYQLKFELYANAMTDYIVYLRIAKKEQGVKEWMVEDVIESRFRTDVNATKSLDAVGFGTSRVNENFYFEMSEEDDPHDFLLTTRNQPFVYVKNFMQVKFLAAGRHVFGLGERVGKFDLKDGIYSLWNYDMMHEETGLPPGNNMYSYHPFYMLHTHNPTDFAGVFFLTSSPMDVRIKHIGMQTEIDHMLVGGILEIFLIGKGPAEFVMREYQRLIGKPTPLPFWAFGYHQSRWGYKDLKHLERMVTRFEEESIPLDGIWMDKDFMSNYKSFTVDSIRWSGLARFVKGLHEKGKHFVALVDAGIAIDKDYSVYARGQRQGVFIKSSFTNDDLVGITWAGYSVWTDFINPAANTFWEETLNEFRALIDFDGLWLDMNELSNFCDGECPDKRTYHYYYFPLDYYDDLYYNPTHRPLEDNTVSMEALHYGEKEIATEFNYHAMYGFYQSRATARYFVEKMEKRPFVISSSTFPGSGRYVAHWLGDNHSSWQDMENSIAGMLNFNMFGIPFVGANVCGYTGNATERLCARWMQLGAFYPFMRNHNSPESSAQEPYDSPVIKVAAKKAILARYSLVRYIYSEYMHTVLRGGSLIFPMTFMFPTDNETYSIIDTTFMVGPCIRVTPIFDAEGDTVRTYFPNADWYSFVAPDYDHVVKYNHSTTKGQHIDVSYAINGNNLGVHIRGGSIVPFQDVSEGTTNILQLHDKPINLMIVPNHYHVAYGEILYDSEHRSSFEQDHQDIRMILNGTTVVFHTFSGKAGIDYKHSDVYISKIIILGAAAYKDTISAKYDSTNQKGVSLKILPYDNQHQILTFEAADTKSMNIQTLEQLYWSNR